MATPLELFAAFTIQLFVVVDPLLGIPIFLAITPQRTFSERERMARRGCLVAFLVLVFFLLAGPPVFGYFGIGTAAVRICGGILLFVIALEMLYGRMTGTGTSPREERLAGEKDDISITPLAIPLLAGPGAIATALLFAGSAATPVDYLGLLAGTALVLGVTYLFLRRAELVLRVIGNLGMTILTRIMGLILAFLSVQYVLDGLRAVFFVEGGGA
jgi:multiple antibiotic resistance protein